MPHWGIAVAAAALLSVGLGSVALLTLRPEPEVYAGTYTPKPEPERTPLPFITNAGDGARVLILGDSYTEGWGSPDAEGSWAYQAAAMRGWNATISGVGSTGYMNAGLEEQGTYAQRAAGLPDGEYDLIILQGGSNDQRFGEVDLQPSIHEAVTTLQQRFPSAQLVMVGPASAGTSIPAAKAYVDRQLSKYARANRIHYISPAQQTWFPSELREELIDEPTGHPNTLGYTRMAEKLLASLDHRATTEVFVD